MKTGVIEMQGTLQADGTLILDTKPDLPPGRVRVTMQPTDPPLDVIEVLRRIHAGQAARGHVPRTGEAIDADIAAMREEDEQRMQEIERLHEEYEKRRQPPPGAVGS